jgi:LuxR family transcriptional regulator, maltose regulon positive regulatory protein
MHVMVERAKLVDRLHRSGTGRVTLITAPAGYGKTTLAEQWARTARHPVASLSISRFRASAPCLLEGILHALGRASLAPIEAPSQAPQVATVLAAMDAIVEDSGALTVILDDFENLVEPDALAAMDALIAGMPRGAHIMMLSRSTPRLTLARLRATGDLHKLSVEDLRFTLDETTALLDGLALAPHQVRRIMERTEGWITGIRQAREACVSAGPGVPIDDLLDAGARDHWLAGYFQEEVFDGLPVPVREFVLLTSAFTMLEPKLCAAALEIENAEALLDELVLRGAFVTQVAPFDPILRYHRLFADVAVGIARKELGTARLRGVWERAASFLAGQERFGDALELAARAADWDAAAGYAIRLVRAAEDREWSGTTLERLNHLPQRILMEHDELAFAYIRACSFSGVFSAAKTVLDAVLPRWAGSDDPTLRGYAASAQTTILGLDGDADGALEKCYEVLALDRPAVAFERLHAWAVIYHLEFLRGNTSAAEHAYQEAARCQAELGRPSLLWDMAVRPERASQAAMRGDLHTAERMYRDQLLHSAEVYRAPLGKLNMRLALIYLEWNHLDRALEAIGRIEDDKTFPYDVWRPEAAIAASRVYWASGRHEAAEQALRDALAMLRERGGTMHLRRAQALQASYWLASGQADRARDWATIHRYSQPDPVRQFGDVDPRIPMIQVCLSDGTWEDAADIARQGVAGATVPNHAATRLAFLVWHAVALAMGGETERSDTALREALDIGVRGTFLATFHPPGYDLGDQLERVGQTAPPGIRAYIDQIAARHPRTPPPAPQAAPASAGQESRESSLTPREREVLALMQQGHINRQIADQLYITERTVKKHIANIRGKLNAPNRTAAVARAYEYGLLD